MYSNRGQTCKMPSVYKMRWAKVGEMKLGFRIPSVGPEERVELMMMRTYQSPNETFALLLELERLPKKAGFQGMGNKFSPQRRVFYFGFVKAEIVLRHATLFESTSQKQTHPKHTTLQMANKHTERCST